MLSDCQIILIPRLGDQIINTRLMVEELKVAIEVEREENRWICKQNLSKSIKLVMDEDNEMADLLKRNHAKLKKVLTKIFKKNISTVSFKVCKILSNKSPNCKRR